MLLIFLSPLTQAAAALSEPGYLAKWPQAWHWQQLVFIHSLASLEHFQAQDKKQPAADHFVAYAK